MKNCEKKTLPVNWLTQRSDTVSVFPQISTANSIAIVMQLAIRRLLAVLGKCPNLSKFVRAASQNRATASPAYKVLYVLLVLP